MKTLQYFQKNLSFFAHKKLKKPPSKVAQKSLYPLFFPYCLSCKMAWTEEFMFQYVAYRPTVYRTGALEEDPEHPSLPQDDWWLLIKLCFSHLLHSDLRLLTIVWCILQRWSFLLWFFDKNNKLVLNFKMTNSFFASRWLMASNKAMLFPFIAFRPKVANYC